MSDDEFDWHASDLAKTNPNVVPPELPDTGRAVAGEVQGKSEAPVLVEISTIRVLGDIGTRLEAPAADTNAVSPIQPALAPLEPSSGPRISPWVIALAGLGLAGLAWALVS